MQRIGPMENAPVADEQTRPWEASVVHVYWDEQPNDTLEAPLSLDYYLQGWKHKKADVPTQVGSSHWGVTLPWSISYQEVVALTMAAISLMCVGWTLASIL